MATHEDKKFDPDAFDQGFVAWGWRRTESLRTDRELPRLQKLPDGNVLIVGGGSELLSTAEDSTELYATEEHRWEPGPGLRHAHRDPETVALPSGDVLVIGGSEGPTKTGSVHVERLAPNDGGFQEAAPMSQARISHAACLLADGRVLVTGGQSDPETFLNTCELYDPETDRWEDGPPMSDTRATHHLRALPDGRAVVVGGGTDIEATHSVEFFAPDEMRWVPTASMHNPRWGFASALLDGGRRLMVAGGRVPAFKGATLPDDQMVILDGTEVFDVADEQWTRTAPLNMPRSMGIPNVQLVELDDGSLLFPGGRTYPFPYHGTPSTERFDRLSQSWQMLAPMVVGVSYHAFTRLDSGEILTAGGRGPRFRPMKKSEVFEQGGR